jgi:hypothetical protein
LSEPNYSATAFVYALENPRSGLGRGRSAGVQPMRANAGLATAVLECEAMQGLEVKNTVIKNFGILLRILQILVY